LLENDLVNIVQLENANNLNEKEGEYNLVQLQKYLVLPKVGLINEDQRFIRVVRGPQEQIKKNNNKIYYVGVPNHQLMGKTGIKA
jgi:hypothetical protein